MANCLVVDDDIVVLESLTDLLETCGFSVTTAGSAENAIAALQRVKSDLVITDIRMETTTAGFEVIKAAKAHNHAPAVVILTAYPIATAEWRASGADALFMKGRSIDLMLSDLKQMLERCRRRSRSTSPPARHKSSGL